MSEFETIPIRNEKAAQHSSGGESSPSNDNYRLVELEIENSRLHRLVAELLIKNQQLRKQS